MSITRTAAIALSAVVLSTLSLSVAAQTIAVKCETRSNRSKASVDGNNLASGQYRAVLTSGANSAQSDLAPTVGDEVGFDFDSNRRDIRNGATAIAPDFIVNQRVTGQLLNASGAVVAQASAKCRAR